jgi:hypothetical protein
MVTWEIYSLIVFVCVCVWSSELVEKEEVLIISC